MIDFEQARVLAQSTLSQSAAARRPPGQRVVVVEEDTVEDGVGWIFFTQSEKYLKTGKFRDRLIGNSPIFVDRTDGSIVSVPTYQSAETFLAAYGQWRTTHPPAS